MVENYSHKAIADTAAAIIAEINALPKRNTPNIREIRRKHSNALQNAPGSYILELAREILKTPGYRSVVYELISEHKGAFQSLDEEVVEDLGQGINSWRTVDSFSRTISGPAWLAGLIPDGLILGWTKSKDLWWRRAALVSTVALNARNRGGFGDTLRTLAICSELVEDHEDMVVKGLSWALRELVPHDPEAVRDFLESYEGELAARVRREVQNKLRTGLKNPKSK